MTREHSDEYRAVIASARWKKMRADRIKAARQRCERCGKWPTYEKELELHHKTYERLGAERPEDVELLCKVCHTMADKERAGETEVRRVARAYSARLDGWASKVYGDDWYSWKTVADVEEEFERWLERKGE